MRTCCLLSSSSLLDSNYNQIFYQAKCPINFCTNQLYLNRKSEQHSQNNEDQNTIKLYQSSPPRPPAEVIKYTNFPNHQRPHQLDFHNYRPSPAAGWIELSSREVVVMLCKGLVKMVRAVILQTEDCERESGCRCRRHQK